MQSLIEIKNLKHSYIDTDGNEIHALNGVSLDIYKGEFLAVIGANGSGKSTLARHLNALLLPTEGKCIVAGMDTADDKNLWNIRQHVGMVFQNPDNQIVAAIVEEDVAFGPENIGVPPTEIRTRVDNALAAVGMTEYAKHAPISIICGKNRLTCSPEGRNSAWPLPVCWHWSRTALCWTSLLRCLTRAGALRL